jgi:hypothetical protein
MTLPACTGRRCYELAAAILAVRRTSDGIGRPLGGVLAAFALALGTRFLRVSLPAHRDRPVRVADAQAPLSCRGFARRHSAGTPSDCVESPLGGSLLLIMLGLGLIDEKVVRA